MLGGGGRGGFLLRRRSRVRRRGDDEPEETDSRDTGPEKGERGAAEGQQQRGRVSRSAECSADLPTRVRTPDMVVEELPGLSAFRSPRYTASGTCSYW